MDRLDPAALGGVSAAREMSGSTAFRRAEASSKMAQAASLSAADEAGGADGQCGAVLAGGGRGIEAGGGRYIHREKSGPTWLQPAQRVVTGGVLRRVLCAGAGAAKLALPGVGDSVWRAEREREDRDRWRDRPRRRPRCPIRNFRAMSGAVCMERPAGHLHLGPFTTRTMTTT
jgi:hypothetical protein